ncbi:MAG TPA: hypothetical protein VM238_18385 [Phycisphaerae bacterium]|nr:hypothetical protein [Phycisphaerae bacterium]
MSDVLVVCCADWANGAYRVKQELDSLGLDVVAFKGMPHQFAYADEVPMIPGDWRGPPAFSYVPRLKPYAEAARCIMFMSSQFVEMGVNLAEKKCTVWHGGSDYRMRPKQCNDLFNPYVEVTMIGAPDEMGIGAKNEVWIPLHVDTAGLDPVYERRDPKKVLVGHFPSNAGMKGTGLICAVMDKLKADPTVADRFEYIGLRGDARLSWPQHMNRVRQCDVYIDQIMPSLGGRPAGYFGTSSIEAAALGKVVMVNNLYRDQFHAEFGAAEPMWTNTAEELEAALREVLSWTEAELRAKREATRDWMERIHGLKPVAERMWEKVFGPMLDGKGRKCTSTTVGNGATSATAIMSGSTR